MRLVRYSVAASLDGFIADAQGGHDWIIMDPSIDFGAFMSAFDTVLLGRGTYEASKGMGGGGMPGIQSIVCSRTLEHADGAEVEHDAAEAVRRLRSEPGKDIWLFGGGGLFRSLLDAGEVDRIEVAVIPVLLGGGVPMIAPGARSTSLKLLESRALSNGTVGLTYAAR